MTIFRLRRIITKWTNYEYWPWLFFYLPAVPVHIYYFLKTRYFFFNTAANPGIDNGGLFGESKIEILNKFGDEYKAKTFFHKAGENIDNTLEILKTRNFELPLIAKPNIGERGDMVAKVDEMDKLAEILKVNDNKDYIIQEFVTYPLEFGVLYGRMPDEAHGKVRSIVQKRFLTVEGDGESSIGQLLLKNKRAWFQIERLEKEQPDLLKEVLLDGEQKIVEHIGNHCKGTEFINANHLISEDLNIAFDKIAKQFDGFYYGRFDLKAKTIENFKKGETIKLFELNGATSEPGHIYDKNYTLLKAYRDIFIEYNFVYKLCKANISRGVKPLSAWFMVKLILGHFKNKST
ncbi:MAG: hypothetical protein ACKVQB_02595 [Bacteroidia bacterium]